MLAEMAVRLPVLTKLAVAEMFTSAMIIGVTIPVWCVPVWHSRGGDM